MRSEVNPSVLTLGTGTFVCKTKSLCLRDRDVPRDNTFLFPKGDSDYGSRKREARGWLGMHKKVERRVTFGYDHNMRTLGVVSFLLFASTI